MLDKQRLGWLTLGVAALALVGCGGGDDDDDDQCTPPNVVGAPVLSDTGLGKAHGKGELPAGVPNGMELEVMVDAGTASSSVFPDNFQAALTCGASFSFQIHGLDPGMYRIGYNILDPKSDTFEALFEGTSTNSFTITGSEDIAFDPIF